MTCKTSRNIRHLVLSFTLHSILHYSELCYNLINYICFEGGPYHAINVSLSSSVMSLSNNLHLLRCVVSATEISIAKIHDLTLNAYSEWLA
ncbi:hypothetical protein RJT34_10635 [Clitoria ternatea]|uniref:Uncharacterized protein n=1 Tax=Clitoria ternatea TaxID=43366 RepID=A0AAN9PJR8_CLITE